MKINITDHFREDSLIAHMVLHTLTYLLKGEIDYESLRDEEGNVILDLQLLIEGKEIDVEDFMNRWQKHLDKEYYNSVKEKAENIVGEKFTDINDLLYDLEGRVKEEVNKRLEDWEEPYE